MSKNLQFESGDKKQVSFYFSKKKYEQFLERYPNLTSFFLCRVLDRAINESDFVENVILGNHFVKYLN